MTETQERFLRAVLTRVPVDSVVELYLFPPIRRGTLETGVAFIATVMPHVTLAVVTDASPEETLDLDSPYADEPVILTDVVDGAEADAADDAPHADDLTAAADVRVTAQSPRMRILTASYRHTIKGVERGKWTVDVQEEADAPLDAVEAVLRGVRHRSTEPADPELVSHDALTALLAPSAVAPAA